jgi:small conductance mechanosensitive channel
MRILRRFRIIAAAVFAAAVMLTDAGVGLCQGQPAASPAALPAAAPVSTEELQGLLDTLQSTPDRDKLIEQLRALIAASRAAAPPAPAAEAPPSFFAQLSEQLRTISTDILATATVVIDVPYLVRWIESEASDVRSRELWGQVLLHLAIVFGLAAAAEFAVRWMLKRPLAALSARSSPRRALRAALWVVGTLLDLLPIAAFAGMALLVLQLLGARPVTERVAEIVVRAILTARVAVAVAHGVLLWPESPALLLGASEETRNYLYIWTRRFVFSGVYGYAIAEAAWWLGAPGAVYATLLKCAALVLAVLAVIFILQNRKSVSEWLRGNKELIPGGSAGWWVLRHRLADIWHVLAIVYVVGLFAVYALRIPGGFSFLLQASLLSILLIVAARVVVRLITVAARRGFAVNADLRERFPTLEARANRYLPILSVLSSAIIYLMTGLALLQAWGIDAFHWFESTVGRQVTGSAIDIGIVLAAALLIWEVFSSAVDRSLAVAGEGGRTHGARVRTLLPLLRTAMATLLVLFAGLMVLSEIGVNIGPLLAGAGIVGIAIGFGSQALVKDVINGLFILIEDTLAVGDVVDVGGGHTGTVERISIRSLKLRDMAGTVHTIPFSAVTTVNNLTRDYAYVVADIGIVYRQDPDRAIAVLREVGAELRQVPEIASYMIEPLEIVGVDRFTDSAVVIRVRIKTRPLRQWAVGREFNRRMKKAFDRNGIEMPAANQTRYLPELSRQPDGTAGSEPVQAAEPARPAAQ